MKKIMQIFILLLAFLLVSCGKAADTSAAAESVSQTESASQEEILSEPEEAVLPIEGIDAENYPYLDGPAEMHPLLARIYREICGISSDEAETLVPFSLRSSGSIWKKMLTGTLDSESVPDLLIIHEPSEEMKESYAAGLADFEIDPIGRDALVFFVNAQNPVDSLTRQQLSDIYTGMITNWSMVGGEEGEVRALQRNTDSGSQTLFRKLLMQDAEPVDLPEELRQRTTGNVTDAVTQLDATSSAIGYSVCSYTAPIQIDEDLKILSVDGVASNSKSVADCTYPLTNDFYVVIRADEPADSPVRALRDWLLTDAGRQLLEEENYVWARTGMESVSAGVGNPFALG